MQVRAKSIVHDHVVDEHDHQHLTPHKEYLVVGIDYESFRVVDDAGERILYPKDLFDITNSHIPDDWVRREYEDDEYHIDPPECAAPGFYEDWFDGDPTAQKVFQTVYNRLMGEY